MSGVVTVGVRPTLLIKGITFILGNNLADGKVDVNPELQVIDEPEQPKFRKRWRQSQQIFSQHVS